MCFSLMQFRVNNEVQSYHSESEINSKWSGENAFLNHQIRDLKGR